MTKALNSEPDQNSSLMNQKIKMDTLEGKNLGIHWIQQKFLWKLHSRQLRRLFLPLPGHRMEWRRRVHEKIWRWNVQCGKKRWHLQNVVWLWIPLSYLHTQISPDIELNRENTVKGNWLARGITVSAGSSKKRWNTARSRSNPKLAICLYSVTRWMASRKKWRRIPNFDITLKYGSIWEI